MNKTVDFINDTRWAWTQFFKVIFVIIPPQLPVPALNYTSINTPAAPFRSLISFFLSVLVEHLHNYNPTWFWFLWFWFLVPVVGVTRFLWVFAEVFVEQPYVNDEEETGEHVENDKSERKLNISGITFAKNKASSMVDRKQNALYQRRDSKFSFMSYRMQSKEALELQQNHLSNIIIAWQIMTMHIK